MFTFGREHEKKCAAHYLRDTRQVGMMEDVIDAVHDVLEGKRLIDDVRSSFAKAFSEGGSGVWEQTASWMTKLAGEHPELLTEWQSLAAHKNAMVRFRVACCLNDMPYSFATEIGQQLMNDRGTKVRTMAAARLEEIAGEQSDIRETS